MAEGRWCWHRWSKWERVTLSVVEAPDWSPPHDVLRQQSRCKKCGKYRTEKVGNP